MKRKIINLLGKTIFSTKIQQSTDIDLSNLSKGIYLMNMGLRKSFFSQKIIIE